MFTWEKLTTKILKQEENEVQSSKKADGKKKKDKSVKISVNAKGRSSKRSGGQNEFEGNEYSSD